MQLGIPPQEARQVQGACIAAAAVDTSQTDATKGGEREDSTNLIVATTISSNLKRSGRATGTRCKRFAKASCKVSGEDPKG